MDDRTRRWRMFQRGTNLLADLYPAGIDGGPSYRDMPEEERSGLDNLLASRHELEELQGQVAYLRNKLVEITKLRQRRPRGEY